MTSPRPSGSPPWSASSKRLVWLLLLGLALLVVYRIRSLLLPFVLSIVLAYLIEPVIEFLTKHSRLPRTVAIALVYLVILAVLVSVPVSAIPPIANQVTNLINNTPQYLAQLGEFLQRPITIANIEIPIDELPLEQLYVGLSNNIVNIVQTIGSRSLILFGSVATATLSTVGWTILVLFLSFYLVKDHHQLIESLLNLAPPDYRDDLHQLGEQMSLTWNAFLRGQMVLCLVVGTIVFVVALILDLPSALLLAIIAGLAEFLPSIGPVLAAIPAALLGFFQSESSWLGSIMSPFWFMVVILIIYAVIYQLENYYLVPRIMGHHLKLHALVVILGALAGASVAGILGILLAAPTLASLRLIFTYIYGKLTDQPLFPPSPPKPQPEEGDSADSNE